MVSPEPDLDVLTVEVTQHRCLVLGTDGFWNMVSPQLSVSNVAHAELFNEECLINHTNTGEVRRLGDWGGSCGGGGYVNPCPCTPVFITQMYMGRG